MSSASASTLPVQQDPTRTLAGIGYGAGAGALWGLVFLAPKLVGGFGPLHLSAGRYLFYGLIAAAMIAPKWRSLSRRVSPRQWLNLFGLALAGNTLYYVLMAAAVQTGGIAMTSLVIGFLPVAVTIIGSRDTGAVRLRRLLPSLALCALGGVFIGWQSIAGPVAGSSAQRALGLACAVGALVSWTVYAVGNARCLGRLKNISAHDWNLLTGIVTGAQSLALVPLALAFEPAGGAGSAEWLRLGLVSLAVAVLASLVGNGLWNRMSRLLPLTLVGQMILFETAFALLYAFAWERRMPTLLELAALGCVIASVLTCLAAHRRRIGPPQA